MFSKSILLARGLLRVAVSRPAGQPQRPYSLYEPDYLDVSVEATLSTENPPFVATNNAVYIRRIARSL